MEDFKTTKKFKETLDKKGITPKELFRKADQNQSLSIDIVELKEAIFQIFEPKRSTLKKVLTYMNILDANKNGIISYKEFMAAFS